MQELEHSILNNWDTSQYMIIKIFDLKVVSYGKNSIFVGVRKCDARLNNREIYGNENTHIIDCPVLFCRFIYRFGENGRGIADLSSSRATIYSNRYSPIPYQSPSMTQTQRNS